MNFIEIDKLSSRTQQLYYDLVNLGFSNAVKALELVIHEMCAEKGYKRYNGVHYYYHLVDTTQILINFRIKENKDENLLVAALLHDIVEDVPGYTVEKIEKMFNKRVAEIVSKLSKKSDVDYSIPENLINYLEIILEDEDACYIKTADRVHNFSSLRYAPMHKKLKQVMETEKYFIPFFKRARNKYTNHSGFFLSAKTDIEPHLWEIQAHYETIKEKEALEKQLQNKGLLSRIFIRINGKLKRLLKP